jgi:hypothetical protein
MDSSSPTGPPEAPQPAPDDLTTALLQLADRVAAGEAETAGRFEAMRAAYAELRNLLQQGRGDQVSFRDDQRRRLIEFLGYQPTAEQQMQLFVAFSAWHATLPRLVENRQAGYTTKKGQLVEYGYADLAGVIATGQSAAAHGLSAITRQELDDQGGPVITAYLVHSGGGTISSGPVPLFIGDSDRRGQAHAAGLTTCRRLALQMVLGLAAERDEDFNANTETGPRQQGSGSAGGRRVASPQQRPSSSSSQPTRTVQGPPPGWISKDERRALEQELMDPAITPERFAEVEAKLLAADQLAKKAAAGPAQAGP